MKQSSNLDFNGMAGDGVNRGKNRLAGNHSGLSAVVNAGRGPTKGNMDIERGREEFGSEGKRPYTRPVPSTKISNVDKIGGHPQFRGDSTVAVKKPGAEAKINVGRGPTKGNCGC